MQPVTDAYPSACTARLLGAMAYASSESLAKHIRIKKFVSILIGILIIDFSGDARADDQVYWTCLAIVISSSGAYPYDTLYLTDVFEAPSKTSGGPTKIDLQSDFRMHLNSGDGDLGNEDVLCRAHRSFSKAQDFLHEREMVLTARRIEFVDYEFMPWDRTKNVR